MDPFTSQALSALLPPEMVDYLYTHVLHPSSPVQSFLRSASLWIQHAVSAAIPIVGPLLDRLLDAMSEHQGATGLVVALAVVTAVVVIMNWVRRLVMWWTRLVARLTFWTVVVLVVAAVWQRGLMITARDLVVFASKILGYLAALRDVWVDEYNHYESQQRTGASGARGSRSSHR
ncbi:hypothetical protein ACRE_010520 [Hapsidospora chrysogenum ATCC 11550]|uniref:Uncharacterized protein n=1 Tax=Hapsidospora chrysogenum (strain ATCC 11550 / CBS 779.69 / DSM 880 / IAM 14645 / JCM 23072 / IMI 49137) TaxID=857340 RepID=A0A086TFG0_HAPC1|nr:hypothetical protein ACRE_010520 [Hapsidospora chrysogenum ATCC 11550]